jgi:hypothetical protein
VGALAAVGLVAVKELSEGGVDALEAALGT